MYIFYYIDIVVDRSVCQSKTSIYNSQWILITIENFNLIDLDKVRILNMIFYQLEIQ